MTISPNPAQSQKSSPSEISLQTSASPSKVTQDNSTSKGSHNYQNWSFDIDDSQSAKMVHITSKNSTPPQVVQQVVERILPNLKKVPSKTLKEAPELPTHEYRLITKPRYQVEIIDQLALKQLGLTPEEVDVLDLAENDKPYIKTIVSNYVDILKKYSLYQNELLTKDHHLTHLSPLTLLKVIKAAILNTENYSTTNLDNHEFMWIKDQDRLQIFDLTLANYVDEGRFGEILSLFDLNQGKEVIAKGSKDYARDDLLNEYQILKYIHQHSSGEGILEAPISFLDLDHKQRVMVIKKKEGDLEKYIESGNFQELTYQQRYQMAYQLVKGLNTFLNLGILHGDLKGENILIKKGQPYISDFGGAINLNTGEAKAAVMQGKGLKFVYTRSHTPQTDQNQINEAAVEKQYEKWVDLQQKRDIYGMGCVLYEILSEDNSFPYEGSSPRESNPLIDISVFPEFLPEEVALLIQQMLHPIPSERPSHSVIEEVMRRNFISI